MYFWGIGETRNISVPTGDNNKTEKDPKKEEVKHRKISISPKPTSGQHLNFYKIIRLTQIWQQTKAMATLKTINMHLTPHY